jgi:hypothetical protein
MGDVAAETKYAILMETANETLSDIWSHLSGHLNVHIEKFDSDEDLLIYSTAEECKAAQSIIEAHVQQNLENLLLLLLPDTTDMRKTFTDYGFISQSSHPYVYADSVFLFSIRSEEANALPYQAYEQIDEHLLASFSKNSVSIFVTDSHSDELMQRIARAYRCSIIPLHPASEASD